MFTKNTTNNKEDLQTQAEHTLDQLNAKANYLKNEAADDYQSVKQNIGALANSAKRAATQAKDDIVNELSDKTRYGLDQLENYGAQLENRVKNKPAQSILWAFGAGILASFIFGRK